MTVPGMAQAAKVLATALALALAQPAVAEQAPPRGEEAAVGTWKLNLDLSIPPQGQTYRPFTIVIRESGSVLDFTQFATTPAGKTFEFSHRTATDGVERDLPGMPGARVAMTRLPSGVIDAKLRFADGSLQNKVCLLQPGLNRQVCLATITAPNGTVSFFRHVLDRVK